MFDIQQTVKQVKEVGDLAQKQFKYNSLKFRKMHRNKISVPIRSSMTHYGGGSGLKGLKNRS